MSPEPRRARVSALAKINLGLRVLGRRPDDFHEIRTVFQTISLADRIEIELTPARGTAIQLECRPHIPANLVEKAAGEILEALKVKARLRFRIEKRIPMGSGLGGGSSDAAAVLLAVPVLAGKRLPLGRLLEIAAGLGSDVPFFLLGGAAVGLGRGQELYPLPDLPPRWGVLLTPGLHVSTPEAYRALGRELTPIPPSPIINSFQSCVWAVTGLLPDGQDLLVNDFESVVFDRYPQLASLKSRLRRQGAAPALLTGSGSAIFGLFGDRSRARQCASAWPGAGLIRLVSRPAYRSLWRRWLRGHTDQRDPAWPPRSMQVR